MTSQSAACLILTTGWGSHEAEWRFGHMSWMPFATYGVDSSFLALGTVGS